MTIEKTSSTATFHYAGTADHIPVPFPLLKEDNLAVAVIDPEGNAAALAQGTDYTIAVQDSAGQGQIDANITLLHPPPSGWTIRMSRHLPISQEHVFFNQGPNSPTVIEESLDKLTMICQELADRLGGLPIEALLSGQSTLDRRVLETETLLTDIMPSAPGDGRAYVAAGRGWLPLDPRPGEPFHLDAAGYVAAVRREAYVPSNLWDIGYEYISVSPSAALGDQDSLFRIDADGYCIVKG